MARIGSESLVRAGAICFLALALVAASVGAADAANTRKAKRLQSSPAAAAARPQSRNPMAENGYNGYYEHIEDRVPFGSKIWWDVYFSRPRGG